MTQETLVNTDSIRARLLWLSTIEEPSERERNICRQAAAALEQQQAEIARYQEDRLIIEAENANQAARIRELEQALRDLFERANWPEGVDLDGFEIQEWAHKHGLLTPETRHEPCAENCHCAEYYDPSEFTEGVTCYRKAPFLLAAPKE